MQGHWYPRWWFLTWTSVVFYYKTTMWSCLSWIACSHVCSRTSSWFGAYYRSPSPENLATSSRRIVLQTFIFPSRLDESGISWHQPELNLRQIWWLVHFPRAIILVSRLPVKWMSWPTHLAGRPIVVVSRLNKLATSPYGLRRNYSLVVPYGFLCS